MVLELIRRVRDRGLPVILISHNMPHVFEIADRIHIARLGRRAALVKPGDISMPDAVAIMTGATRVGQLATLAPGLSPPDPREGWPAHLGSPGRDHDVAVVHWTVIALEQQRPGISFDAVDRAAGNPRNLPVADHRLCRSARR